MENLKVVSEFLRYKDKIEEYGLDVEVNPSNIAIKKKTSDGNEIFIACLNDPIALQGFVQGLECLICSDGDGRMDHITQLITEKHKNRF